MAKLSSAPSGGVSRALVLFLLTVFPAAFSQAPPVVWYPFYDPINSTTAKNYGWSGSANNGNLGFDTTGATTGTLATANPTFTGEGLSFTTVKYETVEIDGTGFAATFTSNPSFSISMCAKFSDVSTATRFRRLFDISVDVNNRWGFYTYDANLGLLYRFNGGTVVRLDGFPGGAASPLVANQWKSITISYNGVTKVATAYIDGISIGASAVGLFTLNPVDFATNLAGARAVIGYSRFNDPALGGTIANWKYYGSNLTAAEALANNNCDPANLKLNYLILEGRDGEARVKQNFTTEIKGAEGRINTTVNAINSTVNTIDAKVNNLTTTVNNINSTVNTIDAKVDNITSTLNNINSTVDALDAKVDNISTAINNINSTVNAINSTVNTIDAKVDNLTTTVNSINSTVNAINSTVNIIDAKADNLTTTVSNINSTVNTIDAKVDNITTTVNNINSTVNAINSTVNIIDAKIDNITATVNNINSTVNTIDAKIDNVTTTVSNINSTVNTIDAKVDNITTTVNSINSTVNTINSTVNIIDAKIDNITATVNNINGTVNTIDAKVGDITTTVNNINSTVSTIDAKIDNVTTTVNNINSTVNAILGKVDNITATIQEAVIANTTTEIKAAEDRINANGTIETKAAEERVKQNTTAEIQAAVINSTIQLKAAEDRIVQNMTTEIKNSLTDVTKNTTAEIKAAEESVKQNLTIPLQIIDKKVDNITTTVNNINTTVNNINTTLGALNTRLGCLNATSSIFQTTPGLGCNGFDDNCNSEVDECAEDAFKPFFVNPDCQAALSNRWVGSAAEAKQVLCDALKPRDDCTTDQDLQVKADLVSGTCGSSLWSVSAKDKCNNTQSANVTLPFYPSTAGPNLTLSADTTAFNKRSFFLTDIGFKINATDPVCPGAPLSIKLSVWSDEGYAPTYDKPDWRDSFAQVIPQVDSETRLLGYDVWLLPVAFKIPCDPKFKILCSSTTSGSGYSRNYIIKVTITNPAGFSITKKLSVSVALPLRRTSVSSVDAVTGNTRTESNRMLHAGTGIGHLFKLVEVEGILGE